MLKKHLKILLAVSICLPAYAELRMTGGGIGGYSQAIAISETTLCIGEGPTLSILDVSQPDTPHVLDRLRLVGSIESLSMDGGRAFAACGRRGVHILTLASPGGPAVVGTIPSAAHSYAAFAADDRIFLADGSAGLRLINITNPSTPMQEGTFATEGPARDIIVQGNVAYVLDYHLGLLILDVSDPTSPVKLSSVESLPFARDIHLSGTTILLVDEKGQLALINVSDLNAPSIIGTTNLAGPAHEICAKGNVAFAALGATGVQPINIATPSSPAPLAPITLSGHATALTISEFTAYVAAGFGGLRVVDISTPVLTEISAIQQGSRASQIVTQGDIAFVAAGEAGLNIYNLTNAEQPVRIGGCPTAGNARDLALMGNILYIADDLYGLSAVNVTTPAAPSALTTSLDTTLTAIRTITASEDTLAVSDGHQIQIFNGLDPKGTCAVDGHVFDLAFKGDLLLAAAGNAGLLVIDTSNTAAPTVIGTYNTSGSAMAVTVSAGNVYVADDEAGSLRIDLSTPSAPALDQAISTGAGARAIALSADIALTTGGNAMLRSSNLAPTVPVELETFTKLVHAMQLAVSGSTVLVSEEEAGIAILSLNATVDNDRDQMPDSWEQQIADANPDDGIDNITDVTSDDDFDGDGLINIHEFIAGTNPTDPDSTFAQIAPEAKTGEGFAVQWHSVSGKHYTIHKSTDLMEGFTILATDISGDPPVNSYTDTASSGRAYYMITVQP
ncbi:MAG: hypothetical protein ISS35_01505 [Kiritimatiellae bacterium]|nr:hypothetical protein [Kiritimatiellia bacterium]